MSVKRWNGTGWDIYSGTNSTVRATDGRSGTTMWVGATTPSTPNDGDVWIDNTANGLIDPSTFTASGDMIVGTGAGTYAKLAVGTSSQVLIGGTTPAYTSSVSNLSLANAYLTSPKELTTVSGSAPAATTNFDLLTQGTLYYTGSNTSNITLNFRGNGSTTVNSIMNVGDSWTAIFLATNGSTPYYPNVYQVDGTTSGVTVKWSGGTAPSAGDASSIDAYSFVIIKTASATYTILAGTSKFA